MPVEHTMPLSNIYTKTIIISSNAIDENGHVNNVSYVQWMHAASVLQLNITHPSAA
jgi:acyl-ACP thioesterase